MHCIHSFKLKICEIINKYLQATMLKKNKSKHPPVPPALGTINGEENRKTIDES